MAPAIAVATDFSVQAEHARQVAMALAKRLGASITLIHSVEPDPADVQNIENQADARRRLGPILDAVRTAGLSVRPEVVSGYPEEVIATAAKQLDARLLVMGTHGRRAPLRWLLGSVAERTLQSSEVPVLVVSEEGKAFARWAEGAHPLRVTVALESAVPDEPLIEAARLFQRAGSELRFVQVTSRGSVADRLPMLLGRVFRDRCPEFAADLQLIPDGVSLAGAIATFLSGHPTDLTIVGVHERWDLEFHRTAELARVLLRHRVGSVLAVPLGRPSEPVDETPTFDSILAPTDLSELGNRAVRHAYALTRDGSVVLLHVHPSAGGISAPLDAQQRGELEAQLRSLVPSDATSRGIATDVVIAEEERPARAIVDIATRLGCGVICMGSYGRSAIGRVVLGSVAEEVIRRFPRAVFIVR